MSPCSSADSGPTCDILDVADVADVFVKNSIPQSVVPWCTLNPQPLRGFLFLVFLKDHILYFIQCACFPVMLMSNFRSKVSEAVQVDWACLIFHLLRFLQVGYRPLVSTLSLHARLPILEDTTFWISRMSLLEILSRQCCTIIPLIFVGIR